MASIALPPLYDSVEYIFMFIVPLASCGSGRAAWSVCLYIYIYIYMCVCVSLISTLNNFSILFSGGNVPVCTGDNVPL